MGFQLFRFIKLWQNKTDDYAGTVNCSKSFDDTMKFIKGYMAKGSKNTGKTYHGDFVVVKDRDWNTWWEIEKQVQDKTPTGTIRAVLESMLFRIQYRGGVVTQVQLQIRSVSAKKCFDEFEADFSKLPNVKAAVATPAPQAAQLPDLSEKSLLEVLDIFEKTVKAFGESSNASTFENVKKVKKEVEARVDAMEIAKRAPYAQCLSKIDLFVNAINTQLSNPAMASSIQSFAGTYVSQMKAEIVQMATISA